MNIAITTSPAIHSAAYQRLNPDCPRRVVRTVAVLLSLVFLVIAAAQAQGISATVNTGIQPWDVAVNTVTHKIYVANRGSNTVTVVDGTTRATTTVPVGDAPEAIAINTATNMIYVADFASDDVVVIDGATNATTKVALPTFSGPFALAVNPTTNKVYVANFGTADVAVLDANNNNALTLVPAGLGPNAIAINTVTNQIYSANYNSNDVTVIDGATNATTTVQVGTQPNDVAVNEVTNQIYTANLYSDDVTVIDGATNATTTVTFAPGSGPYKAAINSITNQIYIADQFSGDVNVIDGTTNSITTVPTGSSSDSRPLDLTVNPLNNLIYVANYGSDDVTIIDGATNSTTTFSAGPLNPDGTGPSPSAIAVDPGTKQVYVTNLFGDTMIVVDSSRVSPAVNWQNPADVVYGTPLSATQLNATFTAVVNGATVTVPGTAVYTPAIGAVLSAGNQTLSVSFTPTDTTNYGPITKTVTLNVTIKLLTVTAADATRFYGNANPTFVGTITGLMDSDIITATYFNTTDALTPIGTYPIVPVLVDPGNKLGNYNLISNFGTLTIDPAGLTVTAANAARLAGAANPVFTGTITGLKNGDAITATYSSVADATSPAGFYPITPTIFDPTGALGNYTLTINNGTLTVEAPPSVVSVTPNAGTATTQLFQLTYSDGTGFGAIIQTQTIFSAVQTYGNSCAFLYTAATGSIQMKDDSGLNWSLPAALGAPGVLQNTQCSIDAGASSAAGVGNTLTLKLAVSFKPSYIGSKNIYMYAVNKYGLNSTWQIRGTWTLPGNPSAVSVTPSSGTGTTQLFQVKYSDPTGFASITLAQAIFSSAQTYGHSCAFLYTASTGSIQMKDDSGLNWSTPAKLGIAGLLENSQCSIDVGASSAVGAGNNLTLNYALTFKPAYAGAKSVFMLANNKFNLNSTWLVRGSWTVPSNPPTAVSVTPTVGSGLSQLFQLSYSDPAGFGAIVYTQTILSSARTYGHSCAFLYTASTGSIQMKDDSGLNWGAAAKLGIAGLLENSQCSIDVGASTAVGTGTNLTLNYAVTFKPAYAGAKNTYTLANNKFGLNSTWQTLGTWTVPAGAPSILSVTPSTGTGLSQLFQFTYSDPAGFSAITTTQAILGSVRTYGHSCAVLYTASTGTIQIKDDAGLNWSTAAKLGVPGVLQNSQCSIDAGASSAVGSVNNLTLNIATTFQTTYVGTKNIYSLANNKFGLNSGWQTLGTWIP